MKILKIISSIALAKFFRGDKLIKRTYNISKNNLIQLIENKIYKKSEIESIDLNKENLSKTKNQQFVIINKFGGYVYDILYINRKVRVSSVYIIEIFEYGEESILVYSKDEQINKKMDLFFFLFYFFGFITMLFEIGLSLYNYFGNSLNELNYNTFGITIFYLSFVLIWGILIKLYIEIFVTKKIKLFMNQFEEIILK
jgi:hypothetical protein